MKRRFLYTLPRATMPAGGCFFAQGGHKGHHQFKKNSWRYGKLRSRSCGPSGVSFDKAEVGGLRNLGFCAPSLNSFDGARGRAPASAQEQAAVRPLVRRWRSITWYVPGILFVGWAKTATCGPGASALTAAQSSPDYTYEWGRGITFPRVGLGFDLAVWLNGMDTYKDFDDDDKATAKKDNKKARCRG
jgi:hypothetical protein